MKEKQQILAKMDMVEQNHMKKLEISSKPIQMGFSCFLKERKSMQLTVSKEKNKQKKENICENLRRTENTREIEV